MATHNLPKHADIAKDVISDADGNTLAFHRPPLVGMACIEPARDTDPQKTDSGSHYGSESLVTVFARMVWQHVKLACWLTVGLGIVMMIFSANSKKSVAVVKHPLVWVLQFVAGAIGLPILLFVVFVGWLHDDHRVVFNLGLFVIYLVWLFFNTRFGAVPQEFWVKHGTSVRRRVWMDDVWGPEWDSQPQFQEAARPWFNAFRKWLGEACESDESGLSEAKLYTDLMACTDLQRIEFFADQTADLPAVYTDEEHAQLTLVAMAPWLLLAALVLTAIPWHGAADAACYHGCTAGEADAIAASTPAPEGLIGRHELQGKVTIVAGEYAGGGFLDCNMGYSAPADGTYTVSRVNYNRLPDKDGGYLEFPPTSFLTSGVEYKRIICSDWRKP